MPPRAWDKAHAHNLYMQTPLGQAQSKSISKHYSVHNVVTFSSITARWTYCNMFSRTSFQWVPQSSSNRREPPRRIKYLKPQQPSTHMFRVTLSHCSLQEKNQPFHGLSPTLAVLQTHERVESLAQSSRSLISIPIQLSWVKHSHWSSHSSWCCPITAFQI